MTIRKKIISLILTVIMCFSFIPVSAFAQEEENITEVLNSTASDTEATDNEALSADVPSGEVSDNDVTGSGALNADAAGNDASDSKAPDTDVPDNEASGNDSSVSNTYDKAEDDENAAANDEYSDDASKKPLLSKGYVKGACA